MLPGRHWPVTLTAGPVLIRPLRRWDKMAWSQVRGRNRDWLGPWDASSPEPGVSLPSFSHMVSALQQQARTGTALPFAIIYRDERGEENFAGQLTVAPIVWGSARTANAGYWVDRHLAGRNIVPTALALATDHCFGTLGLHRMEINIRPGNKPSLRVVQKLGFRDEGLRERYLHINGAWADHRSFAITADEVPGGLVARLREGGFLAS